MIKTLFSEFNPKGLIKSDDKRFRYIDVLYVIGILLVVWGHSHPIDESWHGTWYSHLNGFIYTFHMPLFFFIGGYLMVFSRSVEELGYFKWALGKICKFLVPYIVLTALAYYPKSLLGDTSDIVSLSFEYFLTTTFLIPRIGVWGHFWFIPTFLILDLAWGAWRACVKKSNFVYRAGLIIGFLVSLALAIFPLLSDYFVLYDLSQVALFYASGIITALLKPVLWDKHWKNWLWIVIGALGTYFLYPFGNAAFRYTPIIGGDMFYPYSDQPIKYIPFNNFIVGMFLVWACWNLGKSLSVFKFTKSSKIITQYNFTIYLYSWPIQAFTDVILRRIGTNWLIIIAILFAIGFIVPAAIIFIYKKATFLHCKFMDYLIGIQTTK
ncbi:MAG: acyltransferase [Clostridia bacterium]|nr:acyltransferase [Clostridia bacterium]